MSVPMLSAFFCRPCGDWVGGGSRGLAGHCLSVHGSVESLAKVFDAMAEELRREREWAEQNRRSALNWMDTAAYLARQP